MNEEIKRAAQRVVDAREATKQRINADLDIAINMLRGALDAYEGVTLHPGGAVSRDAREVVSSPQAQEQVAALKRMMDDAAPPALPVEPVAYVWELDLPMRNRVMRKYGAVNNAALYFAPPAPAAPVVTRQDAAQAYTKDQMQKYGAACAEEMRERAAKACEEIANKPSNVVLTVAITCMDAIRALEVK